MPANPSIEAYIREAAIKRGIDPDTAVKVARSEALNVFDPSKPDLGGDEGSSFGPFQLHYKGMSKSMPHAGLGDEFTRQTGLNASDPSTWRQQIDFSLDQARRGGWSPWMGAKASGITGMMGINGNAARPDAASPQMAADMASPGNAVMMAQAPQAPAAPMQGPPNPAAMPNATAAADDKKGWRTALSKAIGAFQMPKMAMATAPQNTTSPAARVDSPEVANFDPNQIAAQRQQLAMAMQRLNSGRLWG